MFPANLSALAPSIASVPAIDTRLLLDAGIGWRAHTPLMRPADSLPVVLLPPPEILQLAVAGILFAGAFVIALAVVAAQDRSIARTILRDSQPDKSTDARITRLESELQARDAELRQAREDADLYFDTISHDIANLDHIALGYLELAEMKLDLDAGEKELIEKPRKAIETTARLISYLKSTRRIKLGSLGLKVLDLDAVVTTAIEQCRKQGDAELRYRPQPGARVMGADLLIEAFTVIIETAISLSSDPVKIDIELSPFGENDTKHYRVTIDNQGPGLPEEYKGRLFGPRKTGQITGSLKGPGLHLVKAVIEACSGRISGEDRTEGGYVRGCRFEVLLPATGVSGEAPGTGSLAADT
ncbi:sensor histidine kinase [Methanocella sp. MCL-LM]|uniref:sensor histidine kinase n=1 Tax=Methanocella sp. MCL-LM TaxID=3412035 RepID=UPI003C71CEBA